MDVQRMVVDIGDQPQQVAVAVGGLLDQGVEGVLDGQGADQLGQGGGLIGDAAGGEVGRELVAAGLVDGGCQLAGDEVEVEDRGAVQV